MLKTETTKPLAEQTPCEIDTRLAELYEVEGKADNYRQGEIKRIKRAQFIRDAVKATHRVFGHTREIQQALKDADPLTDEYQLRRWSRFFLVCNGNGHVHSSMYCETCFPTTQYS